MPDQIPPSAPKHSFIQMPGVLCAEFRPGELSDGLPHATLGPISGQHAPDATGAGPSPPPRTAS